MAELGTLHHAPDIQDSTLAACGKTVGSVTDVSVTTMPVEDFIGPPIATEEYEERCPDCLRELTAKAARSNEPTDTVLTSELPKSQPEEAPTQREPAPGTEPSHSPYPGPPPPPPNLTQPDPVDTTPDAPADEGGGVTHSEGPA